MIKPRNIILIQNLKCELMNQDGSQKGSGISYYQSLFPLDDIELQQGDTLCISVFHSMKREILPGISDIGMKVVKN
jgi:gliding motility-associated lipoprotein GldH